MHKRQYNHTYFYLIFLLYNDILYNLIKLYKEIYDKYGSKILFLIQSQTSS